MKQVFGGVPFKVRGGLPCIMQYDPEDWDHRPLVYTTRGEPAPWLEKRFSAEDWKEAIRTLDAAVSDAWLDAEESKAADQRDWWN